MIKRIYDAVCENIKALEAKKEKYVQNPGKDFTRLRKISFFDCIMAVCCMSGGTLFSELIEYYQSIEDIPSVSAFLQQRSKLKYSLFEDFFKSTVNLDNKSNLYRGYRLLAADGSDIQIPCNPKDKETFFKEINGGKPYNLIHLNALYDILSNSYQDVVVQGRKLCAEQDALNQMVDRSDIQKALIIADRGYESYNVMAHIKEKGWKYLIRVKDITGNGIVSRLELPQIDEFDIDIDLKITRKFSNETKILFKDRNHYRYAPPNSKLDFIPQHATYKEAAIFYQLPFRVVRFKIDNNKYETIVTNLDKKDYDSMELKKLYAMRWGIETSFRTLKYNVGMIYFHSWKKELVLQELFARLAIFNIAALIASHIPYEKKKKYTYKINASKAILICKKLFLNRISPESAIQILSKSVGPIRNERAFKRRTTTRIAANFIYRVA